MTLQQLEHLIMGAVEELREARRKLEPLAQDWALADQSYRKAQSIAYAKSSGTIPERKAFVDDQCNQEMYAAHSLEAIKEAAKENVRALQTEVSAYQTLASLLKSEMQMAGQYEQ